MLIYSFIYVLKEVKLQKKKKQLKKCKIFQRE